MDGNRVSATGQKHVACKCRATLFFLYSILSFSETEITIFQPKKIRHRTMSDIFFWDRQYSVMDFFEFFSFLNILFFYSGFISVKYCLGNCKEIILFIFPLK